MGPGRLSRIRTANRKVVLRHGHGTERLTLFYQSRERRPSSLAAVPSGTTVTAVAAGTRATVETFAHGNNAGSAG